MTRLPRFSMVSLAVLMACTVKSSSSSNPDAGKYDDYYAEVKDGDAGAASGGGDSANSDDPDRPKPRTMTSTQGAAPRKGKPLSARKPPVPGGGGKPRTRPTLPPTEVLAFEGFHPTNAPAGSIVEIFGSGFGKKGNTRVLIGGKAQETVEIGDGHMLIRVKEGSSGPMVLMQRLGMKPGRTKRTPVSIKSEAVFNTLPVDGGFGKPRTDVNFGLVANVYDIGKEVTELPDFKELAEPVATFAVDNLDVPAGQFSGKFVGRNGDLTQWFAIHFQGSLNVTAAGTYDLCLLAGDGAQLYLDDNLVVNNDGVHDSTEKCESMGIEPGEYKLDVLYFQAAAGERGLQLLWAKDGGEKVVIPRENLFPPEAAAVQAMARN